MYHRKQYEDVLARTMSEYLSCHPTYTIPLMKAHYFIMNDVGPVNHVIRRYIGIIAASRHRCTFLVNICKKEFTLFGGDQSWIATGFSAAPDKIRSLSYINKVLAHQPWLLKVSDIESLVKGPNCWSLTELAHIITIMAHYHALCTLSFGCKFGTAPPEKFADDECEYDEVEIEELRHDSEGLKKIKKIVRVPKAPVSRAIVEKCRRLELEENSLSMINSLMIGSEKRQGKASSGSSTKKNGRRGSNKSPDSSDSSTASSPSHSVVSSRSGSDISSASPPPLPQSTTEPNNNKPSDVVLTSEDVIEEAVALQDDVSFAEVASVSPLEPSVEEPKKKDNPDASEWRRKGYDKFLDDPDFGYIDFAKRGRASAVSTFRTQDYQWDDQGYTFSNYLYPDIGSYLDEKFKVGYNLTYYTLGPRTNVDTSPFRRAIWNYIQSIYGMRSDDYNYREVNILLERNLKSYIKCLGCYPELVSQTDYSGVMKGFRSSEKIHVIIMVVEARLQAEILYAFRLLMDYVKLES